ncbi:Hypothetical protein AT6N2_L1293 [Agrobacterium tumefaciens]|nr:Hypothetical protein AT6N2_L1293 [Agrobacterium tumefaciens]
MRLPIQDDLQLHVFRPAFGRPLKSGDRLIEGVGAGNQRLQINLARGNQRQRTIKHIRIAENGLDTAFTEAGRCKVNGDRFRRQADDDHRSARTHDLEEIADRSRRARAFENDVRSPTFGCFIDGLNEIDLFQIDPRYAAIAFGKLQLRGGNIRNQDPRAAAGESGQGHHDADRAAAGHNCRIAGRYLRPGGRLHPNREWFDHSAFGKGDIIRQFIGEACGMNCLGAQNAVDGRRRPESDGRIDVVEAEAGGARFRIGDTRLHANPVARLQMGDTGTGLDDGAGRLVTENHGLVDDEVTDASMSVIMHVAAADADSMETNANVIRPHFMGNFDVAQGKFADTFEDKCFHGSVNLDQFFWRMQH